MTNANPLGVLRIEFGDEAAVFGAIAPRGPQARDPQVQDGYRIARQNCFHCHNMGDAGGQKAGHRGLGFRRGPPLHPIFFGLHSQSER